MCVSSSSYGSGCGGVVSASVGATQQLCDAHFRQRSLRQPRSSVRDAAAPPAEATAEGICYISPGPARTTVADNTAAANFGSAAAPKADTRSASGTEYPSVSVEYV